MVGAAGLTRISLAIGSRNRLATLDQHQTAALELRLRHRRDRRLDATVCGQHERRVVALELRKMAARRAPAVAALRVAEPLHPHGVALDAAALFDDVQLHLGRGA